MTTTQRFLTPIELDRDTFMRRLIASLGHLNEGLLGNAVAGAYIMNVGLSMGAAIEAEYKEFWGIARPFTLDEYAHVIVDLKQKIQGNFSLVAKAPEQVVVRTTSCPFDAFVRQSPSLCFMTSSVFGGIAARNFGYAKVVLHQRIALGDPGCYVTVHLRRTPEAEAAVGREYFPEIDQASPDIVEQLRLMDSLRRLRRQLSEASSRWDELMHGAAEAIAVFDRAGHVAFANARWRDLLGVEGEELAGLSVESLAHADDRPNLRGHLARVQEGERAVGVAARLRHRDESWREVSVSAGPVRDEAGMIVAGLMIVRDVGAERESERIKDTLLATASHELRTPVSTIRGLTQVLLRTLERGGSVDPTVLAQRLQTIQRETDRLALLSADLVDVARLQQGKLAVHQEQLDLREVLAGCVDRERERLGESPRHQFELRQPAAEVPVLGERARLEQLFGNLLENAVKYSPDGGTISVGTEHAETAARVTIADPGIGVAPQDIPRLGTPFFRGANASTRHFEGLGLGLHLSRAIVEAHGGELTIASGEGRGTTCIVAFPLSDAEPQ